MKKSSVEIDVVQVVNPDNKNLIFGQSHFIKTIEDIHEALIGAVPGIQFGVAFCEASGPRLIRTSGTHPGMIELAAQNARIVGCGHSFFIFLENAFPINVLPDIKQVQEVVSIFAATANPLQVVIASTEQGRGVLGVIDGASPTGVEKDSEKMHRKEFLRNLGYKL